MLSRSMIRAILPAAALLAGASFAVPASATDTTFAAFTAPDKSLHVTNSGPSAGLTVTETGTATFSFQGTSSFLDSVINGVTANVTLSSTTTSSAATAGLLADQPLTTGSIVFTSTAPYVIGSTHYAAGKNLLTVNFTNAQIFGVLGTKSPSLQDSTVYGGITFGSDFLNFPVAVSRELSISMTGLSNNIAIGPNGSLKSFSATPQGSFSQDPAPTITAVVPEPASWLMMLVGFGAIGLGIRSGSRRKLLAA